MATLPIYLIGDFEFKRAMAMSGFEPMTLGLKVRSNPVHRCPQGFVLACKRGLWKQYLVG